MATFSTTAILDDAADRANVPPFTSTTRTTTTRATYWLTQAAKRLQSMIMTAFPDAQHFAALKTAVTTPSSATVAIPLGTTSQQAQHVLAVYWHKSARDYVQLEGANYADLQDQEARDWQAVTPTYKLRGALLEFNPIPLNAESLSIYLAYSDVYDTIGSSQVNGWEDHDTWIALEVARHVLLSREKDDSALLRQQQMLEQRILAAASSRDQNRATQVEEVWPPSAQRSRARWYDV